MEVKYQQYSGFFSVYNFKSKLAQSLSLSGINGGFHPPFIPNNSSEGKTTMNYEDLESEFLQYASIVKLAEVQEMTIIEIAAAVNSI